MTEKPGVRWPPLDEARLHAELVEPEVVSRLVRRETTESTNVDLVTASEHAGFARDWPHFSVLTAEHQTGGRGRLGRTWSSPRGASLSTSIVLRTTLPPGQRHWLTLTAGLALVSVLRRELGLDASLKWPNDVLIGGRKIAGLLAVVPPGDPGAVIVGCGINVLLTAAELPTETSTSLLVERPHTRSQARTSLLIDWLNEFAQLYLQAHGEGDIDPIRYDIIANIGTVGQRVRVELPDHSTVHGTAAAVNDDGALVVDTSSGRQVFHAGDITHLRPEQS